MAKVATEQHHPHTLIGLGQAFEVGGGSVTAPVVHEDQLVAEPERAEGRAQAPVELRKQRGLVADRQDDAQFTGNHSGTQRGC